MSELLGQSRNALPFRLSDGLGEPMSVFTVAGGVLVVLGLWLAVTGRPASV